jgi:hypothetical protein
MTLVKVDDKPSVTFFVQASSELQPVSETKSMYSPALPIAFFASLLISLKQSVKDSDTSHDFATLHDAATEHVFATFSTQQLTVFTAFVKKFFLRRRPASR